jgi:hypothetical protein
VIKLSKISIPSLYFAAGAEVTEALEGIRQLREIGQTRRRSWSNVVSLQLQPFQIREGAEGRWERGELIIVQTKIH